jgi:hypothetical protein
VSYAASLKLRRKHLDVNNHVFETIAVRQVLDTSDLLGLTWLRMALVARHHVVL